MTATAQDQELLVASDGPVTTLTLNRPHRRNALTWVGIGALGRALDEAAADDQCRVVVITGAGTAFCSGGDVTDQQQRYRSGETRDDALTPVRSGVEAVWSFPKPLIAAVNGDAVGAGAALALLCDMRVMARNGRMIFSFARVGLSPDLAASWTLPRMIGRGRAARLLMTGEPIGAAECCRAGLVEQVTDDEVCQPEALRAAMAVAANSPTALVATKQVLRSTESSDFAHGLEIELRAQSVCRRSDDHREGIAAFLEKRSPRFAGVTLPNTDSGAPR